MRYAILGDIHSNLEALSEVLGELRRESIDEYYSIGDIVGYYANPKECIEIIRRVCKNSVAGNHDWACVDKLSLDWFNDLAKEAIIWTANLLDKDEKDFLFHRELVYQKEDFTLVHGTLFKPEKFYYLNNLSYAWMCFQNLKTKILFLGHTHIPFFCFMDSGGKVLYSFENKIFLKDGFRYIVNVGSVGQPRDGDRRASFCIYDTEENYVELRRVEYDFRKTQGKILNNSLPEELALRLAWGR
ncbi:MAG: metallophosphoesterase [Candidatus Omnitrophota bacterium]